MKLIPVACAVLNQTPMAWESNLSHIKATLKKADEKKISLLCFPELCLSGYGCEDMFLSMSTQKESWESLQSLLPYTKNKCVVVGLPLTFQNHIYNTVAVIADTKLVALIPKKFLAGDGIHYEPRWFKPWPKGQRAEIEIAGKKIPIGDYLLDFNGVRVGFEICEEAWVADRPGREMAAEGVDVILNPSASHFAFAKLPMRKQFVLEGSRAFGCSYLYTNLVGNESGRVIYDGGAMIASGGKLLAQGKRFSYEDSELVCATIDIDETRLSQNKTATKPTAPDSNRVLKIAFSLSPTETWMEPPVIEPWERSEFLKEEEFSRAVALGLFDYLRKSKSQGFVVSLSGGADSSAVTSLVALMTKFSSLELTLSRAVEKLGLKHKPNSEKDFLNSILTCVYQKTKNNSDTTLQSAKKLTEAFGIPFKEWDVQPLVDQYLKLIDQKTSWETDDLALQNIQARVRAPGIWLLANLKNALLLTTSNRSEMALGYATMDGDTAGGLGPLGGVDKAFLLSWLRWLEKKGPDKVGPFPVLSVVNSQEPSPELRPLSDAQKSEKDLMPYAIVDAIEKSAIRDKRSPKETLQWLSSHFSQYDKPQLKTWVEKFFRLWSQNQWKRERYAPSFHLDDENLDPRSWCRFPILSGGFQKELKE